MQHVGHGLPVTDEVPPAHSDPTIVRSEHSLEVSLKLRVPVCIVATGVSATTAERNSRSGSLGLGLLEQLGRDGREAVLLHRGRRLKLRHLGQVLFQLLRCAADEQVRALDLEDVWVSARPARPAAAPAIPRRDSWLMHHSHRAMFLPCSIGRQTFLSLHSVSPFRPGVLYCPDSPEKPS